MKKYLAMVLALGLLMGILSGCGPSVDPFPEVESRDEISLELPSIQDPETVTPTTEAPTTEAPTTEAPTKEEKMLGVVSGNVYENAFAKIGCSLDEGWYIYNETELGGLMGMTTSVVSDEDLKASMENSGLAYLFYASKDNGMQTINLVMEDMGLYGYLLSAEDYVEANVPNLEQALPSAGFSNVVVTGGTASFAGETRPAIFVQGEVSGMQVYEIMVPLVVRDHLICVTVCSFNTDECAQILDSFYALN